MMHCMRIAGKLIVGPNRSAEAILRALANQSYRDFDEERGILTDVSPTISQRTGND